MTDPLTFVVEVLCPQSHAFEVWTEEMGAWWPKDHTVSGSARATVLLEGKVGGRIVERTEDGGEHIWGEITAWRPPALLGYRWHIGRSPGEATDVEIRFIATGPNATRVEIEQRGWEAFGMDAPMWRERNKVGWSTLLPYFVADIERSQLDSRNGRN